MNSSALVWWIGICGIIGALVRYYLGKWISNQTGVEFPWGTWVINLSGSFILGLLFALYHRHNISYEAWQMVGVGFCGAYTTFSTFGYETMVLIEEGRVVRAGVYVVSSVGFGLLLAWWGMQWFA